MVLTPVNLGDKAQREGAEALYAECKAQGVDVLFDDRDERPGVKFKDADLIGVPYRITLGKKLAQGVVELVNRRTHVVEEIRVAEAAARLKALRAQ